MNGLKRTCENYNGPPVSAAARRNAPERVRRDRGGCDRETVPAHFL